jgi:hypothetical protein
MPCPATPTTMMNESQNDVTLYMPQQLPNTGDRQGGVFPVALLKPCKALLPGALMDAVVRLPSPTEPESLAADISMVLQKGRVRDIFGCQMEIGIAKEKVALYAKKLFNAEVEAKDGVRYICGPGGMKIAPNPSVILRGCSRDVISGIFGSTLATAISQCPIYDREEKEGRDQTDAVSMTITHQDCEAGRITVFLGEFDAYNFRQKLYK